MLTPPALLEVVRGNHVESVHRGVMVFLDPAGAVVASVGEAAGPVFPRSSLKPLQAVGMLEAGFIGRGASLAISAASHDGEPMHLDAARGTLAEAGLDEAALQCPPDLPGDQAAQADWLRSGHSAAAICHNCSGKHAAMLATCVANGWPTETYRDPEHRLQVGIRERLESLTDTRVSATEVDGCGAPAYAISLRGLALGFGRLALATSGPQAMVSNAMRRYPLLVGGTHRPASTAMVSVPGLIAKDGAEGVWAAALPDGRAFAAKIEDGSARALPGVLAAALAYWGIDDELIAPWGSVPVLGHGEPVGSARWSAGLREALAV